MNENEMVYKEVLEAIAGLDGPLTGEDATCFRMWAQEALDACASQQAVSPDIHSLSGCIRCKCGAMVDLGKGRHKCG